MLVRVGTFTTSTEASGETAGAAGGIDVLTDDDQTTALLDDDGTFLRDD